MMISCVLFPIFLKYLFGKTNIKTIDLIYKLILFSSTLFCLIIVFTPTIVYTTLLSAMQLNIVITVIYCVIFNIISIIHKKENSVIYIFGIIAFSSFIIHDILYYLKILNTFDIGTFGFVIFLLFNAFVLARKFTKSFTAVEILSEELKLSNKKIIETFEAVSSTSSVINDLIQKIYMHSNDINSASKLISEAMLNNSENISEQTNNINNGVNSLQKLVKEINCVTNNSTSMNKLSLSAMEKIKIENKKMEKMFGHISKISLFINNLNDAMEKIHLQSNNINKIVDIINKLSKQTKLLSINASIEASKAQKYGKGFAIIASDIKKLSDSTQESANNVKQFVSQIKSKIEEARNQALECVEITSEGGLIVNEAFESFKEIQKGMEVISNNSNEIEIETKQVLDLADNIFYLFKNILEVSDTIASSAQEVTASTESQSSFFSEIVLELKEIVDHVKYLNDKLKV